jgi:hypothetical protein
MQLYVLLFVMYDCKWNATFLALQLILLFLVIDALDKTESAFLG